MLRELVEQPVVVDGGIVAIEAVWRYGIEYGILGSRMAFSEGGITMKRKKLTLEVPADLLDRATRATGEGITPTVRRGLELVAASGAYAKLRALKGKVKFSVSLSELRAD